MLYRVSCSQAVPLLDVHTRNPYQRVFFCVTICHVHLLWFPPTTQGVTNQSGHHVHQTNDSIVAPYNKHILPKQTNMQKGCSKILFWTNFTGFCIWRQAQQLGNINCAHLECY